MNDGDSHKKTDGLVEAASEHVRTARILLDRLHQEVAETEQLIEQSKGAIEESVEMMKKSLRSRYRA